LYLCGVSGKVTSVRIDEIITHFRIVFKTHLKFAHVMVTDEYQVIAMNEPENKPLDKT